MRAPQAVTFDFWNTLFEAKPKRFRQVRVERWKALLGEEGIVVEEEVLHNLFGKVVQVFEEHWARNEQFEAEDGARLALERLSEKVSIDASLADRLVESFVRAGEDFSVALAPNVLEVVRALAESGIRLGVVCDVGMTPSWILRRYMRQAGLEEYFSHLSFSDDVGWYKPSEKIFLHALRGLGVDEPACAVHIGDLRRTDVAGARRVGMLSVRYRAIVDDALDPSDPDSHPEAHHVVDDHLEVAEIVGVEVDR